MGGLCGNGSIIGPLFYENNLNSERYLEMLNNGIIPELRAAYREYFREIWWLQDGALAYRTNIVKTRLSEVFNDRIIGIGFDTE